MTTLGGLTPARSPCGQNCSYIITLPTPGYSCSKESHLDLAEFIWPNFNAGFDITYEQFLNASPYYLAGQGYSSAIIDGVHRDVIRLEVQYGYQPVKQNLSCIYYQNITTANITFTDGIQSSASVISSTGYPIDPTILARTPQHTNESLVALLHGTSGPNISTPDLRAVNTFGLLDALGQSVSGFAFHLDGHDQGSGAKPSYLLGGPGSGGIVVGTQGDDNSVFDDIRTDVLQDYIWNVTISYLNVFPNKYELTEVKEYIWADTYQFTTRWHFYGPYLATLITGLVMLCYGLLCMKWNGGHAARATFLQALCVGLASDERIKKEAASTSVHEIAEGSEEARWSYDQLQGMSRLRQLQVRLASPEDGNGRSQGGNVSTMGFHVVDP